MPIHPPGARSESFIGGSRIPVHVRAYRKLVRTFDMGRRRAKGQELRGWSQNLPARGGSALQFFTGREHFITDVAVYIGQAGRLSRECGRGLP